jgi:hypothetical protein
MRATTRVITSLFLVTFLAPSSAAHNQTRSDRNDTRSRLDFQNATASHTVARLRFRLATREDWTSSTLEGRRNWITVWTETRRATRVIVLDWRRGALRAHVERPGEIPNRVSRARVRRPDRRTVVVSARRSTLRASRGFKWMSITSWRGRSRCRNGCLDYLPGGTQFSGMIRH